MQDVDRMYRHLVRTIRTSFPQYLSQPFEVGELYSTILPYRLHRRELGLETNQDYESTLLELLSGQHGYLVVDDRMRDALVAEAGSVHPNTERIREFSGSQVLLDPGSLAALDGGRAGAAPAPERSAPVTESRPAARAAAPATQENATEPLDSAAAQGSRPITVPEGGDECPYCTGHLPGGREVSFCPHCGQDLTVVHCPACGSELERGWKFCVTCGKAASGAR